MKCPDTAASRRRAAVQRAREQLLPAVVALITALAVHLGALPERCLAGSRLLRGLLSL